jgi:DNA polymerase-3 subunit alpha/error-prone DNA polymerase
MVRCGAVRYDYLYTYWELEAWTDRIKRITEKAHRILVYFNNHPKGKAVQNALIPSMKRVQKTDADRWEEYHALGFLRNTHPLALWKYEVLAVKYRVKARHIGEYIGRSVKMIGWPVTQKEVWTKDGLTMI